MVTKTSHYEKKKRRFYKDPEGRVRPITPPKIPDWNRHSISKDFGKIIVWPKPSPRTPQYVLGVAIFRAAFVTLAASSPFVGQVYASYQLANGLYSAYKSVRAASNAYTTKGPATAATVLGTEILSRQLAGTQTQLGWALMANRIDPKVQPAAKSLLTECVEKLTTEEIDFVSRHLE